MTNLISGIHYETERALYGLRQFVVDDCRFEGPTDGESPLKEGQDICVSNCYFDLRYPMWHDTHLTLRHCVFTDKSRAPLWYCRDVDMQDSDLKGVKSFRECDGVIIRHSTLESPECMWYCHHVSILDVALTAEYGFMHSTDIKCENLHFKGKYSFQYVKNVVISDSVLDTKDAFWHSENVTVKDSLIRGEYLGWYSQNLTLINCKIIGTQPLCYCKGLRLINCETQDCDFSFEYSEVQADIVGDVLSVKNPLSGHVTADSIGEVIWEDSVYDCHATVTRRNPK